MYTPILIWMAGRTGYFLMNTVLTAGDNPWMSVLLEKRDSYMIALEAASINQNIVTFTNFLSQLVNEELEGMSIPRVAPSSQKQKIHL